MSAARVKTVFPLAVHMGAEIVMRRNPTFHDLFLSQRFMISEKVLCEIEHKKHNFESEIHVQFFIFVSSCNLELFSDTS